jgi:hypothetical protein
MNMYHEVSLIVFLLSEMPKSQCEEKCEVKKKYFYLHHDLIEECKRQLLRVSVLVL